MLYWLAMTKKTIREALGRATSFQDIFQIVQEAVKESIGESRAGLNLGVMELGNERGKFLGAFYPAESNIIIINSTPLRRISETNPELFKPYVFHVLLHEYLHSLGYLDELSTRRLAYRISIRTLGEDHIATRMTTNIEEFFDYVTYPDGYPGNSRRMLLIEDLDQGMDYID